MGQCKGKPVPSPPIRYYEPINFSKMVENKKYSATCSIRVILTDLLLSNITIKNICDIIIEYFLVIDVKMSFYINKSSLYAPIEYNIQDNIFDGIINYDLFKCFESTNFVNLNIDICHRAKIINGKSLIVFDDISDLQSIDRNYNFTTEKFTYFEDCYYKILNKYNHDSQIIKLVKELKEKNTKRKYIVVDVHNPDYDRCYQLQIIEFEEMDFLLFRSTLELLSHVIKKNKILKCCTN